MSIKNLELYNLDKKNLKLNTEMPAFIKYVEKVIKSDNMNLEKEFNDYSLAYLKTTENVNGYYNLLDFTNKTILTVIGAGDQVFNAALNGAKKIDGFDISITAIMFYYLKILNSKNQWLWD